VQLDAVGAAVEMPILWDQDQVAVALRQMI
jgi:hypothetical protein